MTSSINPNNIDTTYPIAGQDNDSQGFRDNFTNIKTNFEYAETEIDDLQAKGIFKSALTELLFKNSTSSIMVNLGLFDKDELDRVALRALISSSLIFLFSSAWIKITSCVVLCKNKL